MHSVYVLCDPRTGETRYVGCSLNIRLRYLHHISHRDKSNQVKQTWIDELKQLGLHPWLILIEENLEKSVALKREKHWIQKCLEEDAQLTNMRDAELLPWELRVPISHKM